MIAHYLLVFTLLSTDGASPDMNTVTLKFTNQNDCQKIQTEVIKKVGDKYIGVLVPCDHLTGEVQ